MLLRNFLQGSFQIYLLTRIHPIQNLEKADYRFQSSRLVIFAVLFKESFDSPDVLTGSELCAWHITVLLIWPWGSRGGRSCGWGPIRGFFYTYA